MNTVLAMACAALALWVLMPAHPRQRLQWVVDSDGGVARAPSRLQRYLAGLRRRLPGGSRRADESRRRSIEAIATLSSELRSGRPMTAALLSSLDGVTQHAPAAARWGGDVPAALKRDADDTGFEQWRYVAACWEVAESSGAGLAAALDRLVASARSSEEIRVQLQAHLAAPRATARMLATLPLIGIILGLALGGDPLGWLLTTPVGQICLIAGVALTGLGLWWVGRIARGVQGAL